MPAPDTREAFNRTVLRAIATGEPCTAKPCGVTPWLSLGSGFKRGAPYKLEGKYLYPSPYRYTMSWDYESIYSWQLGSEINQQATTANPAWTGIVWSRAKYVAFYPSPFDGRSQSVWANGTNSTKVQVVVRHFVSYLRGAAGLSPLLDG